MFCKDSSLTAASPPNDVVFMTVLTLCVARGRKRDAGQTFQFILCIHLAKLGQVCLKVGQQEQLL